MPRKPDDWEYRELDRLVGDAEEAESGSAGGRHAILIAFLCALGYMVSNTSRAIEIAYKIPGAQ